MMTKGGCASTRASSDDDETTARLIRFNQLLPG